MFENDSSQKAGGAKEMNGQAVTNVTEGGRQASGVRHWASLSTVEVPLPRQASGEGRLL